MTKLSSSLPKEYDEDGLGSINSDLVARPTDTQMVVAMIDCKSVTRDIDTGIDIATARILHIEPLQEHEADEARELLKNAQERRTGKRAIPGIVDGKTGEILRDGTGIRVLRAGQ
ncbi:hypothetical protein HOU96_gp45 [Arthrobacter phage Maja]|uniref:Uncharacterized protein n=1 Tax=Arthrobacter phage Maja TaxID=2499009 RepID=A0A3S9UN25_9CAUD|nr:hypothetical protein HOU96_gp45 [Arthrobacter phage Maja]AZS11743.1 hypothetical protein PBI_MAJA_45 [Arthrobacter phage Maja]